MFTNIFTELLHMNFEVYQSIFEARWTLHFFLICTFYFVQIGVGGKNFTLNTFLV